MCKESNQKSLEFVIKRPAHITHLDSTPEKEFFHNGKDF